jgi:tRNA dimethylallyltransferase
MSTGIVILGPTASGKTNLAVHLAHAIGGEIISADSRQVYQKLNIGTGKDLAEFEQFAKPITYHLIDVVAPSEQFYLKDFIAHSRLAFDQITAEGKVPIICGGTGLYLDTFHKDFSHTLIPENETLRETLALLSDQELRSKIHILQSTIKTTLDVSTRKRMIRAIEKIEYLATNDFVVSEAFSPNLTYFGLNPSIELRRKRINDRLKLRLEHGLIEEVEKLLHTNEIDMSRLEKLGLEYQHIALYLQQQLSKEQLFEKLSVAIHQYAKRQMTWFRKMEKEGIKINWLRDEDTVDQKVDQIITYSTL